ncbi:uncharacterized protein LOC125179167 [Hyalella azteca]|uniref:Uncharacterized protein LOC125179167 n=1 Tax=Hyalella azteca TaxID=294128 RepID=A0A979FWP0_HYAAZ|nr:uncharacterized protein LOC125179167 [Hyalella azteca]
MLEKTSHCTHLPFVTSLHWDSVWQLATASGASRYRLYSASCDREQRSQRCKLIRILAMAESSDLPPPYCYIWGDVSANPVVVKAEKPAFIDYQGADNRLVPLLLTCPVTSSMGPVAGVSISLESCSSVTNFLQFADH